MRNLSSFYKPLRNLGFRRKSKSPYCIVYEKIDGVFKFDVQFWYDGHHRVVHSHPPYYRNRQIMRIAKAHYGLDATAIRDTLPIDFTTIKGMKKAIEIEYHNARNRRKP